MLLLGCTDMPFLAKYRCLTCVKHGYWYGSLDFGVRAVSFFFFRFSDMALMRLRHGGHASSEKKKSQILTLDKSLPLILWYTLKQKNKKTKKKLRVWEVITMKVETHSSTLPLTSAHCPLSLVGARSGQSASRRAL